MYNQIAGKYAKEIIIREPILLAMVTVLYPHVQ